VSADERTPAYYRSKSGLQPLDVIDAWGLGFFDGNAVKYLLRWKGKNGLEDLGKASMTMRELTRWSVVEQGRSIRRELANGDS
jgi:hypothetical protein